DVVSWGINSRLDNLQAAILLHSFKNYDDVIRRRREIAARYQTQLSSLDELVLPPSPDSDPDHFDVFQNYEIEATNRDSLKKYLSDKGIGTLVQWGGKAVHQFKELGFTQSLPYTENLFGSMIMLPLNMSMSDDEVDYVCESICKFYK
ncbi:MAG: DegT/DnrJ/EryC1/StrS family aminotransferase, partial [Candidatus Peribacteraceae bacterium]|nr:DegT/DnrJ/EryC1/StrS family aminotransferase [Candidatus Peribacteraceae bacterium]